MIHIFASSFFFHSQGIESETIDKLTPNTKYELTIAGETKSLFSDRYYTGEYSEPTMIDLTSM